MKKRITPLGISKKEYPARIEYVNDNDQLHREDGPAVEWNGVSKEWWINGKCHREDGPACEWNDGDKWYYLNNIRYTEEEYQTELVKLKLNRLVNEKSI